MLISLFWLGLSAASATVINPDPYNGQTFHVWSTVQSFCYKVVVGSKIEQQTTGTSQNNCQNNVFTKQYHLGDYSSTSNSLQQYNNGDSCGGVIGPRRASLTLNIDNSASQLTVAVTENPTCFYAVVITAPPSVFVLTINPDPYNGQTFHVWSTVQTYCYKVVVGSKIEQQTTGTSQNNCQNSVFTKQYHLGDYSSTSNSVQQYNNGDSCGGAIGPRRASLRLNIDHSASQLTVAVTENPTCFYAVVMTAPPSVFTTTTITTTTITTITTTTRRTTTTTTRTTNTSATTTTNSTTTSTTTTTNTSTGTTTNSSTSASANSTQTTSTNTSTSITTNTSTHTLMNMTAATTTNTTLSTSTNISTAASTNMASTTSTNTSTTTAANTSTETSTNTTAITTKNMTSTTSRNASSAALTNATSTSTTNASTTTLVNASTSTSTNSSRRTSRNSSTPTTTNSTRTSTTTTNISTFTTNNESKRTTTNSTRTSTTNMTTTSTANTSTQTSTNATVEPTTNTSTATSTNTSTTTSTTSTTTTNTTTIISQASQQESSDNSDQLIIFVVAVPAFVLLCCLLLICILYLWWRRRPLRKGTYYINDVGPVSFRVFHPNEGPESNAVGATPSQQEFRHYVDENGKIHTIWDLDNEAVEAYLQKFSQQNKDVSDSPSVMASTTLTRSAKVGDKTVEVVSSNDLQVGQNVTIEADTSIEEDNKIAGLVDRACILLANPLRYDHASGARVSEKVDNDVQLLAIANESPRDFILDSCFHSAASSNQGAAGSGVLPMDGGELATTFQTMYYDGCEVEYFSVTNKMWLPGKVKVNIKRVQDWDDSKMYTVTYDVTLQGAKYQEKVQVPLDRLRASLKVTELVDVYSLRQGGRWLAGVIHGTQSAVPAITGYQISLVSSNGMVDKVPANRLRRRFPAGVEVSVYDGCTRGWCEATVMQSAPTQIDLDVMEFEATPVDTLDTPWVSCLVKFDKTGETKTVPSYLILTRSRCCVVRPAAGLPLGVSQTPNPNLRQRRSPGPASEATSITDLWNPQFCIEEEELGQLTQPQAASTIITLT